MAQLLSLARKLPAADASMKQGKWDKKSFLGEEVRGKVLGLAGLGRIGQEVARRAQAFEMTRDRARPVHRRASRGRAQHRAGVDGRSVRPGRLPVAPHAGDAANPAHLQRRAAGQVQEGPEADQHRPRRADRRGRRWSRRSRADTSAARRSTCYTSEPTTDHTLQQLPQVVASPHIAASTKEGQELVGVETASALRDFLKTGVIRNAVNFPSVAAGRVPEDCSRTSSSPSSSARLVGQMGEARIESLSVRYYGELASGQHPLILNAALVGLVPGDPVRHGDRSERARRRQGARHRA